MRTQESCCIDTNFLSKEVVGIYAILPELQNKVSLIQRRLAEGVLDAEVAALVTVF